MIQVPDSNFSFVVELLNKLGIKDIHDNEFYIPEWQQEIVKERDANHNPEKAIGLPEFESMMKKKYGV